MTQTKNTGMSIIGFLQDAPPTARICIIDKGQSSDDFRRSICDAMRQPPDVVMVGELRDASTAEYLKSAIIAQENCVSTAFHDTQEIVP